MSFQPIQASVGLYNGKQCYNLEPDQRTIMQLLNAIPEADGGLMDAAGYGLDFRPARRGVCDPVLHDAILQFQKYNHHRGLLVDGHVDPGEATIVWLNRLAGGRSPRPGAGVAGQAKLMAELSLPPELRRWTMLSILS